MEQRTETYSILSCKSITSYLYFNQTAQSAGMIRSRAGRVVPRTHSLVPREGEFEFDVSQMDSQINDTLKQSIGTAEDAVQRIVAFDDANNVLNAKTPVVKFSVEFHHLTSHNTVGWFLVLNKDVPRCFESTVADSPLPRQEIWWVFVDNQLVVVRTNVHAGVMHNDALKCNANHNFKTAVIIFAPTEHDLLQIMVCIDVRHINICTIKNSSESISQEASTMVDPPKSIVPVNLADHHGEFTNDGNDMRVELVLVDRPSERGFEHVAVESVPPGVMVDVQQADVEECSRILFIKAQRRSKS